MLVCLLPAWAAGLRPYSVQVHLHGSMSEGPGSMRGGNEQARKLGLDVLWWSDHDWRVSYHTFASGYDFESTRVPLAGAPGQMTITLAPHKGNGKVADTVARLSAEKAVQGRQSFEIGAAGAQPGAFQAFFYELGATRMRMKRALASRVEVEFAVYPEIEADKRTMAGVRFDLSQQPPAFERGAIIYVLTGLSQAELDKLSTPSLKYVRLDFKLHQWNRYRVNLTKDARRLGLGGEDNSMGAVSFGVLSTGQRARAFFDDFRIHHALAGEALRQEARRITAALEKEYGVTNYMGQEFSYLAHLNPLGDVPMIDHSQHPNGLTAAEAVAFAHHYGGIISLNHYFGGRGDALRKRIGELKAAHAFGADLLECNPGQLENFLAAWDELSAAGIYLTGDGVSDSHTSTAGWFEGRNFVSWVWARSKSQADLVDGFRRGEVYFGDPAAFHGEVSLSTADGHRMGEVIATAKPSHTVRVRITGLPAGARVRAMVAGAPRAETTAQGDFQTEVTLNTAARTFLRVEARTAAGKPLVFSNPIFFVPAAEAAKEQLPGGRRLTSCP
ncbi:MAG: hypothetical protein M1436_08235 [Acidobacteria bacterium]|nr:hypothetical protein [Acidobacteriota bacterium]